MIVSRLTEPVAAQMAIFALARALATAVRPGVGAVAPTPIVRQAAKATLVPALGTVTYLRTAHVVDRMAICAPGLALVIAARRAGIVGPRLPIVAPAVNSTLGIATILIFRRTGVARLPVGVQPVPDQPLADAARLEDTAVHLLTIVHKGAK